MSAYAAAALVTMCAVFPVYTQAGTLELQGKDSNLIFDEGVNTELPVNAVGARKSEQNNPYSSIVYDLTAKVPLTFTPTFTC